MKRLVLSPRVMHRRRRGKRKAQHIVFGVRSQKAIELFAGKMERKRGEKRKISTASTKKTSPVYSSRMCVCLLVFLLVLFEERKEKCDGCEGINKRQNNVMFHSNENNRCEIFDNAHRCSSFNLLSDAFDHGIYDTLFTIAGHSFASIRWIRLLLRCEH